MFSLPRIRCTENEQLLLTSSVNFFPEAVFGVTCYTPRWAEGQAELLVAWVSEQKGMGEEIENLWKLRHHWKWNSKESAFSSLPMAV